MRKRDLLAAAAGTGVLAAAGMVWLGPWQRPEAPRVGLETLDQGRLTLADLRGQPVVLQFWATTCTTCVAEMPHLKSLYSELAPAGLRLIGVAMSYDPPQQVRRMVAEKQLPYTIALDRSGAVAQAFGDVRLTPTTVLVDPAGRIAWRTMGNIDFAALAERIRPMLPS